MENNNFELAKEFFRLNSEPVKKTYYECFKSATGVFLVEEKECGETPNFYFFYEDMHSGYASGYFKHCNIVFKNFFVNVRYGDNKEDIGFEFENNRGYVFMSYNAMIQHIDFIAKRGDYYRFLNFERKE